MLRADILAQAKALIDRLVAADLTVTTAESCTGGLIAAALTSVPGSSAVFERGIVSYADSAKTDLLGVPATLLATDGAVSASVAQAMAEGARTRSNADVAVAVTGIAGPDGGSEAKPVGLVFLAVAGLQETRVEERRYGDIGRDAVREATVADALRLLASCLPSP